MMRSEADAMSEQPDPDQSSASVSASAAKPGESGPAVS